VLHGIDTSFLVALEVVGHPSHGPAGERFRRLADAGDVFALVPQVLAGFIHVVTNPRRFASPLTMPQALMRVDALWHASEVVQVFPSAESTRLFLTWLGEHQLGRKRLLDTQWAAVLSVSGVTSVLTLNRADFEVFGCFQFPS
jgi:predicted nucleic acid-binding protein